MRDRETAQQLEGELKKVLTDLLSHGITVASVVADNAANIQKALRLGAGSYLQLHCWAHTCNLLMKDQACAYFFPIRAGLAPT